MFACFLGCFSVDIYDVLVFVYVGSFIFKCLGGMEFKLLNTLGPACIVKKVSPVYKDNYVFVR